MKTNKKEWAWIFYDIGNSAFVLFATAIIPILFNNLAQGQLSESTYLAYWGYGISVSTVLTAILGPILGALGDIRKLKKHIFIALVILAIGFFILMPFNNLWIGFLISFSLVRLMFSLSLVIYDSMLIDVTGEDRMDVVSSQGFAWGYIGSVVPFIISIALLIKPDLFGIGSETAIFISFLINAIWWLGWSLPLIKTYKQRKVNTEDSKIGQGLLKTIDHVKKTLIEIKGNEKIFWFLIAYFFYIDGVNTIISMATAYGTSLGLDSTGLVLALLLTQIVAFPASLLFGKMSKKHETSKLLKICIGAYTLVTIYAIQLDTLRDFWILAVGVGLFQGAIQALSRSYFAKIIPAEKSGEYFGIYDIFGKGASLTGTLMVSIVSQVTGVQQLAILGLVIMFVIGFILFNKVAKIQVP